MRIARITGLIAALALFIAIPAVALAQAQPPRPSVFGGAAIVDGAPAPDGTAVTAWIDGNQVASTVVAKGTYAFTIPQPPGKSFGGKEITFKIGNGTAVETGIWETDGGGEVNLTAVGGQTPPPAAVAEPQKPVVAVEIPKAAQPATISEGPGEGKKRRAFVGVVDGEPGDAVTLIRKGNKGPVTIKLDKYKIKMPGKSVAGSFTNGARVVVLAKMDGSEWTAIWVLVKPAKLTAPPVTGSVVSVENGILTIMRPDGTTKSVKLGRGGTEPEIGEVVTAFAGDSDGEGRQGTQGPPEAKGLVKAAKVRERLEGFLQDLTAESSGLPEKASKNRGKRVADVAAILDGHAGKQVKLLERITEKNLPAHAVERVREALARAQIKRDQAKIKGAEARVKAGPPADRGRGAAQAQGKGQTGAEAQGSPAAQDSNTGQGQGNSSSQAGGQGQGNNAGPGNQGRGNR